MRSTKRSLKVAYLLNQYPMPSQTFIRREMAALEAGGLQVERFSLRATDGSVVDPADRAEIDRTRVVLDEGRARAAQAVMRRAVTSPGRFWRALRRAVDLGRGSSRGVVVHLAYLAEACILVGWLRRSRITHVHAHFGTNATTVALLVRELGGPQFSFTVHGPEEFDRPEGLKLGEKVAAAAFTVAITDFCRSQIFRWVAHEHWDRVHVVHCGLDHQFLDSEPAPAPSAPRLVNVGRLAEQKGQLLLVEAATRLIDEGVDFELVLVGDGPLRSELEALVARSGRPDAIQLVGTLHNAAVRDEMLRARAVVLASFAEGLPVVLMEALALGRPVITTYVAGIPELVVDGESGWLIPAGSVDALVEAMRRVIAEAPSRLDEMGGAGAVRARERHDAAVEGARLAELFSRYHDLDRRTSDHGGGT